MHFKFATGMLKCVSRSNRLTAENVSGYMVTRGMAVDYQGVSVHGNLAFKIAPRAYLLLPAALGAGTYGEPAFKTAPICTSSCLPPCVAASDREAPSCGGWQLPWSSAHTGASLSQLPHVTG